MAFSGMLRYVALVRTDVSEEFSYSIIRVTRISEVGQQEQQLGTTTTRKPDWNTAVENRNNFVECRHLIREHEILPLQPLSQVLLRVGVLIVQRGRELHLVDTLNQKLFPYQI
jgi:hypothetical protein